MQFGVVVDNDAWDRIWSYIHGVDTEIGFFGYIEERDDHMFLSEVFLVPQEVSGSLVDFVSDGLPYAVEKAVEEDKIEQLRFCGHSHVNFGTGFSGTDEEMITKVRDSGPIPWLFSSIFNKKGETNCRLDLFDTPIASLRHVKGIKLDIESEREREIHSDVEDEIEKFVEKIKPQKPWHTSNGGKHLGETKVTNKRDKSKGDRVVCKRPSEKNEQAWQTYWNMPIRLGPDIDAMIVALEAASDIEMVIEGTSGSVAVIDEEGYVWKYDKDGEFIECIEDKSLKTTQEVLDGDADGDEFIQDEFGKPLAYLPV